jgi:hypothetical protein
VDTGVPPQNAPSTSAAKRQTVANDLNVRKGTSAEVVESRGRPVQGTAAIREEYRGILAVRLFGDN